MVRMLIVPNMITGGWNDIFCQKNTGILTFETWQFQQQNVNNGAWEYGVGALFCPQKEISVAIGELSQYDV